MKLFLAGINSRRHARLAEELGVRYWLTSYSGLGRKPGHKLDDIIDVKPDDVLLFLDNGAFEIQRGLRNGGVKEYDFDRYLENLVRLLSNNDRHKGVDFVPALDPQNQQEMLESLDRLEAEDFDTDILPVYHLGWEVSLLEKLCERHRMIAVGGIAAKDSMTDKEEDALVQVVRYCHQQDTRTHLFGFSNPKLLWKARHWAWSADNTTWTSSTRYGKPVEVSYQLPGFFHLFTPANIGRTVDAHWRQAMETGMRRWKQIDDMFEEVEEDE